MMRLIHCFAALIVLTASAVAADTQTSGELSAHRSFAVAMQTDVAPALPPGKANRIVVYSASWCSPCQRLKPVIKSLKEEGYHVEYQDIDTDIDKLKYPYRSVPTIYFLSGETIIKKATGYRSKQQIKDTLILDSRLRPSETKIVWR